ncbi:MAG TPA: division/cell wall cluster transcriptional repressor MraZ [Treponema sp.]|jgi:MraZ protein|nr:division/cell wall cluster transcriptional repressor MraZ [Treponema sp.]HBB42003.1 division/cell wall cluster transcriptional repressor MraZ [Treponema sp.]HCA19939.1 division/cell wall cluster transcriptional repressor MraZ [Treponema sp.]
MEMLIGEYSISMDDKGRFMFPSKMRTVLQQNELIVTQGLDHCLMLFTAEEWSKLTEKIMGSASIFDNQKRLVMRRFIAPAQKIEFDKSGRLSVPQMLRDFASLRSGGDCILFGMNKYMELWDAETFRKFDEESASSVQEAIESMRDILL